jgi:Na+/citrate or Na+/malate symporter
MVRAALFGVPAAVMAIVVLALNWLDASPTLAIAALAVVSVGGGALFGIFADRLPDISQRSTGRTTASRS